MMICLLAVLMILELASVRGLVVPDVAKCATANETVLDGASCSSSWHAQIMQGDANVRALPEVPLVRPMNGSAPRKNVLIVYVLFNENGGNISKSALEPALVSMESFRSVGSKHKITFGVIAPRGTAANLSSLALLYNFTIFERDLIERSKENSLGLLARWLSPVKSKFEMLAAEVFNIQGFDRIALLGTGTIFLKRIDELFDGNSIYFTRSPQGGGNCWSKGMFVSTPSTFLYHAFRSVYSTDNLDSGASNLDVCKGGGVFESVAAYVFDRLMPARHGKHAPIGLHAANNLQVSADRGYAIELDPRTYNLASTGLMLPVAHDVVRVFNFAGGQCSENFLDAVCRYFVYVAMIHMKTLQDRLPEEKSDIVRVDGSVLSDIGRDASLLPNLYPDRDWPRISSDVRRDRVRNKCIFFSNRERSYSTIISD